MNIESKNQKLSSKEKSLLRSSAHSLKPVVMIGDNGLTKSVLQEIDHNLNAHGLIKIKVAGDDRSYRIELADQIIKNLNCEIISHVGKILTIYRENDIYRTLIKQSKPRQASERLPNEAYITKKQAAAGKRAGSTSSTTLNKGGKAKAKPISKAGKPAPKTADSKTSKPKVPVRKPSIPIRKGSSLTLRAGRRNKD
ncbi:putative RNA-binding ribosomal protein [Taylorella asinigenitalis 14/45]|uniref:Putative RNA-binding ribosomal protein n=1 Tax=Taylorella asinigenitalis 14/45 TaxID=1091495 RepID=I7J1F8_9BURK|nr:ribosome assembly RNA-binding protein YhbY [Taylorella asinigenitalis]CCG19473.1 putative RNA-binding ribosomal protein [Taylorella asinigenitalis 14/45]